MMNYESISFQDYESITVDELKEQTNSLLNLVTEEQRPLRVFMNDGKAQRSLYYVHRWHRHCQEKA